MIPNGVSEAITQIALRDEELKLAPYKDSNGYWTIGIGHLIGTNVEDLRITPATAKQLFEDDKWAHWCEAIQIYGEEFFLRQSPARQAALFFLVFSLGRDKLLRFVQTLPAIKDERWSDAADLLLKTKWAHDVDPKDRPGEGRDDRIANMLRTGEFDAYYKIDSSAG